MLISKSNDYKLKTEQNYLVEDRTQKEVIFLNVLQEV